MTTRKDFLKQTTAAAIGLGLGSVSIAQAATGTCAFGIFSDEGLTGSGESANAIATKLGRSFAGWRTNADFDKSFPGSKCQASFDLGMHWTYRDAGAGMPGQSQDATWASIASGQFDSVIRTAAQAIKNDGRWSAGVPYHFSFNHEMSIGMKTLGTPSTYVSAYRHVRAIFDSVGATVGKGGNVLFTFVPLLSHVPGCPHGAKTNLATACDPGAQNYDLVGYDYYNKRETTGKLKWPLSDVPGLVAAARNFASSRGKPWFLGEFGVAEAGAGDKAQFVTNFYTEVAKSPASGPGSCAAILYSHIGNVLGDQKYYMDTSASSLQAFKSVGALPYFS